MQQIAAADQLTEGKSVVFSFRDENGFLSEGFAFRRNGMLLAYKNQCRHQPLSLDYGDGDFFTDDAKFLLCRNHGALFEPETGECVFGPCLNATLFPLQVVEESGLIYLQPPSPEDAVELE